MAKSQERPAFDQCHVKGVLLQRSNFSNHDSRNHRWGLHPSIWEQLDSRDGQIWDQLSQDASARGSECRKVPNSLKVRRSSDSMREKIFPCLKATKENVPSPMRKVGYLSTFQPVSKL